MIEINQVSFTYDKAVNDAAIREINIQIPKGQTILLCGESGSGKTTFGRLINGLIPAYYEGSLNGCVMISNISEKITLQNFHFSEGATELLSIEQLDIPKRAVVAVLGNNEAGKTTFARCLCGLEKKAKETLLYGGYSYNRKQRIRICYMVMQDVNHQLFTESVADEVLLGIKDLDTDAKKQAVDKILTELDLVDYKESHPMSLSGGQKQRAAIAGAVSSKKELIIFDEPTSGLDYRHMKEELKVLIGY